MARFAVALLTWLVPRIQREVAAVVDGVRVAVIRVDYLGAYPALGLTYEGVVQDAGPVAIRAAEELLASTSLAEFLASLDLSNTDWRVVEEEVMRPKEI
jgi:hypothetical protein